MRNRAGEWSAGLWRIRRSKSLWLRNISTLSLLLIHFLISATAMGRDDPPAKKAMSKRQPADPYSTTTR